MHGQSYREGWKARADREPRIAPYPKGSFDYNRWHCGYHDAGEDPVVQQEDAEELYFRGR